MKKITFLRNLIVLVALLIGSGSVMGQGTEDFETSALTASYLDGSFTNATTGITWTYGHSRDDGGYPINGKGIMLRRASDSYLEATIPSGFGSFSFQYRKAFTGGEDRQLELIINSTQVATSAVFGSVTGAEATVYDFVYEVNTAGPVTIKIKNVGTTTTNRQIIIDNIVWTAYSGGGTPVVVTPTIQVSAGVEKSTDTYFNTADVTITSATDGASIYYTTNGDAPTTASTLYVDPITITSTTTIKALAVKAEMDDSGVAEKTITIVAPATATIPYTEAFNNTLGDWYNYEVAGAKPWVASANGAYGNGYVNPSADIESWLISPKFTATEDGMALSFNYASRFVGNPLLVKVSSDYIGYGSPAAATWSTLISIDGPEVQDNAYTVKASGNIISTTEGTVYFALVYENYSAGTYSDWRITNLNVDTPPAGPVISVTELNVPAMSAEAGATDTETITVSGVNLTGNITLAITGTDESLFILSAYSIAATEGAVTDASVTITYTPTAAGSHTATLTLSSSGAEDVVRSLSGSATWAPLAAPVATEATGITQTGFAANWNAVAGATEYELSVYTKEGGVSVNHFVNPGFETGETSPWNFESAMNQELVTDNVKSGTYALKTSVTATKKITQSINVVSGKEYKISFWYYIDEAATGSGFRVWTTSGATLYMPSSTTFYNTKGSWEYVETTFVPTADVMVFEIRTYNGNILYLDDFELTYDASVSTPISGSPFTVTDETSKNITDLTPSTTYYYTVVAKNENVESVASNEMSALTDFGTGNHNPSISGIFAHNAQIRFTATAGEQVEVYNAVGQKLISTRATDGQNVLNVSDKGVMIVKVGERIAKVIL